MKDRIWLIVDKEPGIYFKVKGVLNNIFKVRGIDYTKFENEDFINDLVKGIFDFLDVHSLVPKDDKILSLKDLRDILSKMPNLGYTSLSMWDILGEVAKKYDHKIRKE